jgi:hypothetical protein
MLILAFADCDLGARAARVKALGAQFGLVSLDVHRFPSRNQFCKPLWRQGWAPGRRGPAFEVFRMATMRKKAPVFGGAVGEVRLGTQTWSLCRHWHSDGKMSAAPTQIDRMSCGPVLTLSTAFVCPDTGTRN